MANNLAISVIVQAVDRLTKPMKGMVKATEKTGQTAAVAQRRLDGLSRAAAGGAGFGFMEKAIGRANRLLRDHEFRLRVVGRLQSKLESVDRARAKVRGQMLETAGLAVSAAAPIVQAARVEQAEVRLRTVINTDEKNKAAAMAKARETARDLARTGFAGLTQAFDIQYALNSAGLQADMASSASEVVAKVAKVTAGAPEQVGEVIATTYNNLGAQMVGTSEEKFKRIGELLTKTQFKFQIRDFGQLGEGMAYAASTAAGAKIPLEQVVTVLGMLNSAGVTAGRAGTAFNAMGRSLTKAGKEFGFEIVRMADGQMDLIATLEDFERALQVYDDIDERNQKIQEVMGDEGKVAIVPLLEKVKELRKEQADVVEGSKKIIDANAKMFSESTGGQWDKLVNTVSVLADSFGRTLLPGVNAVLAPLAGALSIVADLAEANPRVTATIGGLVTGLIALRVAFVAGKFAMLLFQAGMLSGAIGFLKYGAGLFALARGAIPAVIVGVRAMTAAMAATPIGAIVAVLATVAALIVANWDTVKDFFLKIWEPVRPYWEKFAGFVAAIWDKISAPFQAIGRLFGGGDAIQNVVANVVEPAKRAAAAVVVAGATSGAPAVATPAAAQAPGTASAGAVTIHIHAAPGQSAEDIAREVQRVLERQQRKTIHEDNE